MRIYLGFTLSSDDFINTSNMFVSNLNIQSLDWSALLDDHFCQDVFFGRICEAMAILKGFGITEYTFLLERSKDNVLSQTSNEERYYIDFDNVDDAVKFKLMFKGPNNDR